MSIFSTKPLNEPPREDGPAITASDIIGSSRAKTKKIDVGNAMKVVRPKLGDDAGVVLYRLLRLVALEDIIGRGASGTAYVAGKKLGRSLQLGKLEELLELCAQLKIGIIKVPVLQKNQINIEVHECVTCSGMDPVGRTLCHFEGGMVGGAIETILDVSVKVQETHCIGGLGHEFCGFDIKVN